MTQSETPIALNSTVVATSRQIDTQLDDDLVILNLENSIYYGFQDDPVAEAIWQAVQTPIVVSDVVDRVLGGFDVERQQCETDVLTFLSRLIEEELVSTVS
jgi:hypothetical protein